MFSTRFCWGFHSRVVFKDFFQLFFAIGCFQEFLSIAVFKSFFQSLFPRISFNRYFQEFLSTVIFKSFFQSLFSRVSFNPFLLGFVFKGFLLGFVFKGLFSRVSFNHCFQEFLSTKFCWSLFSRVRFQKFPLIIVFKSFFESLFSRCSCKDPFQVFLFSCFLLVVVSCVSHLVYVVSVDC